jgi:uncharacterized membrane protein
MQFRFHAVQSLLATVVVVSTAMHQQLQSTTSSHVLVAAVTIGRMLSVHVISATMSKQINHSKNWDGDFVHFHANQSVLHGEFLEQVAPNPDGFHTLSHLASLQPLHRMST